MKVAIYIRVSTHMQVEKRNFFRGPKRILIEYCSDNKYEYEIFEDRRN